MYLHNVKTIYYYLHFCYAYNRPLNAPHRRLFGDFFAIFHAVIFGKRIVCRSLVEAILSTDISDGE